MGLTNEPAESSHPEAKQVDACQTKVKPSTPSFLISNKPHSRSKKPNSSLPPKSVHDKSRAADGSRKIELSDGSFDLEHRTTYTSNLVQKPKSLFSKLQVATEKQHARFQNSESKANLLEATGKFGDVGDLKKKDESLLHFSHAPNSVKKEKKLLSVHSKPRYITTFTDNPHPPPESRNARAARIESEQATASKVDAIMKLLDSNSITSFKNSTGEHIDGIISRLLPHQVDGVNFMTGRENLNGKSDIRGGMLCDDMGLGKTLQSIALIVKNKPPPDADIKTTLIVVPLSLLQQWYNEIKIMAPRLSVTTHQGSNRTLNVNHLKHYDAVVTTYDVVTSDFKKSGPLFETEWYRIITDEAHEFRNRISQRSLAVAALKSNGRRWVLTGTPVHNDADDLYALFRFIRAAPYDNRDHWKNDILGPIQNKRSTSSAQNRGIELLRGLLCALMLRRRQSILGKLLPPCNRQRYPVEPNSDERAIYRRVMVQVDEQIWKGTNTNLLASLTKLRLICNDASLVDQSGEHSDDENRTLRSYTNSTPDDLNITMECDDPSDNLGDLLSSISKLSIGDNSGLLEQESHYSSKTTAVRDILLKQPRRKTVVFSSFVKMLKKIAIMLNNEGIGFRIYDGSLKSAQRTAMLNSFRENEEISVLLCSLKCASIGLNIAYASRVIMVEPWWNPMIVDQAVNRVHRLGQTREVDIYELVIKDSLESRIFEIQEKKRALADNVMKKKERLSKEELLYLLNGRPHTEFNGMALTHNEFRES